MRYLICFLFVASFFATAHAQKQVDRQAAFHFNEAVMAFKSNDYETAISSYGKAIGINPNYTKARYNRAKAFLRVKSFKKAIGDLNEVVKADPTHTNAWKYKGYAHMQLKLYPGAINSYNKALLLDPKLNDCRANRAIAFMNEGKVKLAKADLLHVVEAEPDNGNALYNLAVCQNKMKDVDGALQTYTKLIEIGHKPEMASKQRAKILVNRKEYAPAIVDLDKAIASGKSGCEDYYLRGYCKLKTEDLEGADEDFKKALAINQTHKPSIQNKAFTSYKLEKYDEAVKDFTKVLEITPGDKNTHVNRGLSSLKLKDFKSAHSDFSKVIEIDPQHATAYYNRASAAIGLAQNDSACTDMRTAAKLGYQEAFNHIRQICKD